MSAATVFADAAPEPLGAGDPEAPVFVAVRAPPHAPSSARADARARFETVVMRVGVDRNRGDGNRGPASIDPTTRRDTVSAVA